ncbi:hypothetical protein OEZ86_005524 [Tetradesmus obliquus]|nr:hypothetical protein OEZ86_005524 [Tetradesmus obliquus]
MTQLEHDSSSSHVCGSSSSSSSSSASSSSTSSSSTSSPPVWHGLVAGAVSGLSARIVTFPTDTLKARLQIRGAVNADAVYSSTFSAARHMLATEGPIGFYRGFGAVLWGVVPANLAYFGGYELGKALMPGHWGMAGDMATGALAQVLAGVVYTPIDIVKERMQVQALMRGSYSYASPGQAFRALLGGGQGLRGLFRGYWATNCVWLPWNAMYIAGYEQLKRHSCALSWAMYEWLKRRLDGSSSSSSSTGG